MTFGAVGAWRIPALWGLVSAALLVGPAAWARTSAQLVYDHTVEQCPDEPALRTAVATRLGYDPFAVDAPMRIEVDVATTRPHGLRARVRSFDAAGKLVGERTLTSASDDCVELAATMAVTISIMLDPRSFLPGPPTAAPAPPTREVEDSPFPDQPPVPPPSPLPPAAPPAVPLVYRIGADIDGSVGAAPSAALGFSGFFGLGQRVWSVDLEGRADLPASTRRPDGTGVRSSLLLGQVAPCAHAGLFVACPLLALGALQGQGVDVNAPQRHATFYAAAGLRVGIELPVAGQVVLRLHIDANAPLTRTTLSDLGAEVWTTPAVNGLAGLGILGRF